jgi:hypothetical protein
MFILGLFALFISIGITIKHRNNFTFESFILAVMPYLIISAGVLVSYFINERLFFLTEGLDLEYNFTIVILFYISYIATLIIERIIYFFKKRLTID